VHTGSWWGDLREREHLEDLGVMDLKKVVRGMVWIDLAQNWDRWRAPVNAVMNLQVP
jgi:hypothetical protein